LTVRQSERRRANARGVARGLTLETSAFQLVTVADLHFQLS